MFRRWLTRFPPEIDVCAVQLPGREGRVRETPYENMAVLAAGAVEGLRPHLQGSFSFFGYSMGALVAFEVARGLQKIGHRGPDLLIVAASPAPQVPRTAPFDFKVPDHELIRDLKNLNGTLPEVLADSNLMRILLPVIRADIKVVATYVYQESEPLDCPIVAIGGSQDPCVKPEQVDAWRFQTSAGFLRYTLTGKHFFLLDSPETVMRLVLELLCFHSHQAARKPQPAAAKMSTESDGV